MTVMQFDSRLGWYNPRPDIASRQFRCDAPLRSATYRPATPDPKTAPIEIRDFFVLLDQARAGDAAAREELRVRGNRTTRA